MAQKAKEQKSIDYSSLGLKCGLELHQQLDTGRKLFCRCKTDLQLEAPDVTITRHMRPTLSELGEYDKAALMEYKKHKDIIYEIHESTCTYEIDETPPFEPDNNAIDLAIEIALMLDMSILDELHVNRKQYLDGSIPGGFQRTMMVGVEGKIKVENKTINLDMLALEEDSCREVKSEGKEIVWRVDRLGTPLVEIATKTISIDDPLEIRNIAEAIGRVLRSTGKVKRGLGTIRQDLNISIADGARIEIKGVQILDLLSEYIKFEVDRQLSLIQIKNELVKRKLSAKIFTELLAVDCNDYFVASKSKLIIGALKDKKTIYGIKVPKIAGLIGYIVQANRTFGKEIADRLKVIVGLGGILHTDELPNYGITEKEVTNLKSFFECEKDDAVILVLCKTDEINLALSEIKIRLQEALVGVPEETRHANEDGTTSFRRYLGGASRMYPDTDSYPIVISESRIKRIADELPELPSTKENRYIKEYNLPEDIARHLAISQNSELFDELVKMSIDPMLVAVTLEQTMKSLAREKLQIENITESRIKEIFELLGKKKIAKEAIEPLLRYSAESPKIKLDDMIKELDLETISEEELIKIIREALATNIELVNETGKNALGKLMGEVMEKVRGKVDGKIVNKTVEQQLDAYLDEKSGELDELGKSEDS
ncbi:MAG: Glu-tRNA(Gln) amidotransferase subunit GatE [Asgard group archaeon]|nr:Glu-tRNA(Gln) amidotransferase subunit GatE [Asgard group archaeon]